MPVKAGRSEEAQVTVYQKHSSMLSRKAMYMGWCLPSAGRLRGEVSRKAKLWIEALVNGGRNYNGPKVAKFLVGQVPTRMNGIIIWALSRQQTRWNLITCEDAGYPRLDGETPWSFTITYHWVSDLHAQHRWDALKPGLWPRWSGRWDTTLGGCLS